MYNPKNQRKNRKKRIMMRVKKNIFIVTPLLLVVGLLMSQFKLFQQNTLSVPQVVFTTITGKKIDMKDLKGKPTIVTFWATDCASCIKEISPLIDLYDQFHPKGLEIIAVAMYYDLPSHVVAMTKAKQIPYDVALDLRAEHAKAFWQVELTPATFLISPKGDIVTHKIGLFNKAEMKQQIETLLTG